MGRPQQQKADHGEEIGSTTCRTGPVNQEPEALREGPDWLALQRALAHPSMATPEGIVALQKTAGNRTVSTALVSQGRDPSVIQRQIINWRTASLGSTDINIVTHQMSFDPDGDVDLGQTRLREHVSWDVGVPHDYTTDDNDAYRRAGEHFGLAVNSATGQTVTDNHAILPSIIRPTAIGAGRVVFTQRQTYQQSTNNGAWTDVPRSSYEIERSFQRPNADGPIITTFAKRGTAGDDNARISVRLEV